MRYIGNKENLLERIASKFNKFGIHGNSFFDFFAGTTNVGRLFKERNYTVSSCDLLYLSYCLQKAYIENNDEPQFKKVLPYIRPINTVLCATPLEKIVAYLNEIKDVFGFISQNYTPLGTKHLTQPRMYFSEENGLRIDAIRQKIEEWKNLQLINETEYYILLACLIESVSFYANVAGVYGAFYKKWDPRAIKRFMLRPIKIYNNNLPNEVFYTDSLNLVEKSYFTTPAGKHIPLAKYSDRDAYKGGDKSKIISIPDLVLLDIRNSEIITIEGKKYKNRQAGIKELAGYEAFDNLYLEKYYPAHRILRTVVLYGSKQDRIIEVEIGFLFNEKGKMVLGIYAPKLFTRAIHNLLDYWN